MSNELSNDEEFAPLPYYGWVERPWHLEISPEEAATAYHLAHGDDVGAAALLRVSVVRLQRLLRRSPRLQRVRLESLHVALAKAASVPIRTLFDAGSDQRALEWASTKVLQSRLGAGHELSPAPSVGGAAVGVTGGGGRIVISWEEGPGVIDVTPGSGADE